MVRCRAACVRSGVAGPGRTRSGSKKLCDRHGDLPGTERNHRFCETWTSAIIKPLGFTEERGTSFRMARTK